ncbi:MAG: hypothetical protein QXL71_09105 [Candidatus Bathyarchaeia archaeon]
MTDIQGLYCVNPKTKEYLIRVGSLLFPFKTPEEVYAYLKRMVKHSQKVKKHD